VATTYKEGGQEVDVRVQLRPEDRANMDSVRRLVVQTRNGVMVPLSEVGAIDTARGPSEIKHMDQQRAVLISANILKRSSSDVIADIQGRLGKFEMADYHLKLSGESQQMKESFGPLGIAMVMGVLANYMIMAAEFEDLWHPLIVLGTIPSRRDRGGAQPLPDPHAAQRSGDFRDASCWGGWWSITASC
jgi:HAE1 family hydrophobic/amphiphilic exporter-1